MMTKRTGILALLIIALAVFWMRPEKRSAGRNADAGSFILSAHAQTSNYGGVSITSFAANCVPLAPTAASLQCGDLTNSAGVSVTSAVPILLPNGSVSNTSIGPSAQPSYGMYFPGGNQIRLSIGGTDQFVLAVFGGGYGDVNTGLALGFASQPNTTPDVGFRRVGVGSIQVGASNSATPAAMTLGIGESSRGGTDSNVAGAGGTIRAGIGTGTGTPAILSFVGSIIGASGSTAQTQISRFALNDTKQLTSGAASTAVSIPLATLQMAGGTIDYYIEATDGTNQCTRAGVMQYTAENSAGVFVTQVTDAAGALDATSCTATKTLTVAWAVTSANPALVQVTPTTNIAAPTQFQMVYEVHHKGQTAPTL